MFCCIIFLAVLISGKESYQFKILQPPQNLTPRITHNTFEDSNQYINYKINEYDRDFIVFVSRGENSQAEGESRVYYSADGGITIKEADLSIDGKRMYIIEVQSTKGYMLLIAHHGTALIFLDKTGKTDFISRFNERSAFLVHPNFPNLILKTKEHDNTYTEAISISIDYGKEYNQDTEKCSNFAWVLDQPYLNALCDKIFYSFDCSSKIVTTRYTISNIESIEYTENLVFAVSFENDGKRNIYIYNLTSQLQEQVEFPNLLKIMKIRMAKIFNGYIYVVVDTDRLGACLFTSRVEENKFIRLVCDVDTTLISYNSCPVYISRTEGLIYVNRYDYDCKAYVTYISRNNGNSWFKAKFSDNTRQDLNILLHCIKLALPCMDLKPRGKSIRRFEIFQGEFKKDNQSYLGHFFTYDWGNTWSFVPNIMFGLVAVNMGYVMAGINRDTNLLQYTLDEGYTWYSSNIVDKSERVISEVSSDSTDKDFLIAVGQRQTSKIKSWIFSFIDFRNILDKTCSESDYHEVAIPHAHSRCFRGKETFCSHKLNTSLCLHPNDDEKCHEENICPCTYEDFECLFGYVFNYHYCARDPFHEFELESNPCENNQINLVLFRGYRRIRDDQCSIKGDDNQIPKNSTEYCVYFYYSNAIYILQTDWLSRIIISDNGNIYSTSLLLSSPLHNLTNIRYKMDLNNYQDKIFYSTNTYIFSANYMYQSLLYNNQRLYRETKNIDEIWFDSISDSIIYNDISHQLFMVSLKTNFKKLLIKDAFNIHFYENKRGISYFTSDKKFCYYHLHKSSSCIASDDSLHHAKYDEEYHKIFLHFKNGSLIIFSKNDHISIEGKPLDMENVQKFLEITKVDHFDFIGQNLYYLKNFKLFNLNLNHLNKTNLLRPDIFSNIKMFKIKQSPQKSPYNDCNFMGCSYMCEFTNDRTSQCICPSDSILVKNKCVCKNDTNCLEKYCLGFWCGNGNCILEKNRCNKNDDCGNGADEKNCAYTKENIKRMVVKSLKIFVICLIIVSVASILYFAIKIYYKKPTSYSFIPDIEVDYKSMVREERDEYI